jgi:ATP-dependent protease Clp ATPase subunit
MFADGASNEIAKIAFVRGRGARRLRSVVEEVLEGVLFDVEAGVRYLVTEETVRGGEAVRQSMTQPKAPLSAHLLRLAGGRTGEPRQSR